MKTIPLAEEMRPKTLNDYYGQEHLVGKDAMLRKALDSGTIPSLILWGPPGVGKTTLAYLIANQLKCNFYKLSAINSGVRDIRDVIDSAKNNEEPSILFIDEIHRFSKSQQDSLLGSVEQGIITLIGATTENPSFEVISPLLSRCQVYILKSLEKEHLETIVSHAKAVMEERIQQPISIESKEALMYVSGGDVRKLLNAFELTVYSLVSGNEQIVVNNENVRKVVQQNLQVYDKAGEMHYDIISAFIKSLRGSDPNAAVYWLARMIAAGEDPKFIARRMLILASEDIGNANPNAMLLTTNCFQAVSMIGMPESRIILSQTAIYLACSPKSNASYMAIDKALENVEKMKDLSVPLSIRNAPTKLMKDLSYGMGYKYAHDFQDNFVDFEFMPDPIKGKKFYEPGNNPRENEMRQRLKKLWKNKYNY
ncbi:MAG: Replication-associated recombination protein A [Bacteroidetes bacterium ADurb.Bin234]|jgi:putative ATPase|nr:MAG: Replication-associated recombination protein A [Bacteroidetes bacterium ADurb.Bin234]